MRKPKPITPTQRSIAQLQGRLDALGRELEKTEDIILESMLLAQRVRRELATAQGCYKDVMRASKKRS